MSSKGDIFDRVLSSKSSSSSGDVFDRLIKKQESLGREGKYVGGTVGAGLKAGAKSPKQALKEIPGAAARVIEAPFHLPQIIAGAASKILGQPEAPQPRETFLSHFIPPEKSPTPADYVAEAGRRGLGEEERGEAEDISELEQLLFPIPGARKIPTPKSALGFIEKRAKKVPETFQSGLIKPRATEARFAKAGIITPGRQESVIKSLDQQARELTKASAEKAVPLVKQIQEGKNIRGGYQERFGSLKKMAEKANPEIDITPLADFMEESSAKFRNIPSPHADAKLIISEGKKFRKKVPGDLDSLLRTYRSNNRKIERITERARIHGKLEEYDEFLKSQNKAIAKSIEKTLPENSPWVKEFKTLNKEFTEIRNAEETSKMLKSALGEEFDSRSFQKLGIDSIKQKKLQLRMGKEGADEVIQISKDLKKAIDGIKRMPAREYSKFEAALPISFLIPGMGKVVGGAVTLYKLSKLARRGYGWYLSRPAKRKAMDSALNAISKGDLQAYKEAALELKKD